MSVFPCDDPENPRCPVCRWKFARPPEQPDRMMCRSCESMNLISRAVRVDRAYPIMPRSLKDRDALLDALKAAQTVAPPSGDR